MFDISVKVKNYKCFEEEAGFDVIRRVNLIIGKNNSGKSTLLDLIERVVNGNYQFESATWRGARAPQVVFSAEISEDVVMKVFPISTSGGSIPGNHNNYGRKFIGRRFTWSKTGRGSGAAQFISCEEEGISPRLSGAGGYAQSLANAMPIFLEGKKFRRILAERDIVPEADSLSISIASNGGGVTNAIQSYINRSSLPSEIIEETLLDALNEIFAHDSTFTDIVCQLHDTNQWEVYLEEQGKGRVALSKSGSGLKTVLMVLANLFIVPKLENKSLGDYVFGFEELENNIHPSLLRRLNDFIYKSAVQNGFVYFLTTHSNVLIDQFSKQEDAQILHVRHRAAMSQCLTAKTYIENSGILDDLDVRASDLLQANGVIWVEGPSDRVYINRWIQLWSGGALREGSHYQIVFYGGRLLSHLSAEDPNVVNEGVSILSTNRNAILVMDSDKKNQQAVLNDTKRRIQQEFSKMGAICWITKGREVENYISSQVVDKFWGGEISPQVGRYSSFFEYVESLFPGKGLAYANKKPLLSERLIGYMTLENMREMLDLDEQMQSVCSRIRYWNG